MDELMSKASRLRALQRLIDYATTESRELALGSLERLLGAATLAIDEALAEEARLSTAVHRQAQIKLVIGGSHYKTGSGTER